VSQENGESKKKYKWQETAWILALGGQAGLLIAFPVLIGLAGGYFIDRALGTLPFITLFFTLIGIIGGPILVYRWINNTVKQRLQDMKKEE
jgi:F0F1-type ATP synthase assembly protein I